VVDGTRVFIFGGKGAGGALFNDLWELDTGAWAWRQCISTSAAPSPRLGHSQVAVGGRVVVFGGWDGAVANCELWAYDREALAWSRPRATGLPPTPRQGHVGVLHKAQTNGWVTPDLDPRALSVLVQSFLLGRAVDDVAPSPLEAQAWETVLAAVLDRVLLTG
jgi:hypothetical protein